MVAGRIAVEHAVELRYTLRMMGVPVKGPTLLFGDNESMVKNVTLPQSTLKKRHNAIAYHKVRQAVAAGFVGIVHCRSEHNLADWGTKMVTGKVHQHLMHHQSYPPTSVREYWRDISHGTNTLQVGGFTRRRQVLGSENTGGNFRKDPGKVARLFLLRNSHVDDDLVAAFKDKEFVLGLRRATQMANNGTSG